MITLKIVFATFLPLAFCREPLANKVSMPEAIFENLQGNCPGKFLLASPFYCLSCGTNGTNSATLELCADFCLRQGDECRGFTISAADGKCYPKTTSGCSTPQDNGINFFFSKRKVIGSSSTTGSSTTTTTTTTSTTTTSTSFKPILTTESKTALQIYNFTIDAVNPGQAATTRCLVSGYPLPSLPSKFRFEYANGTKIPGAIELKLLTNSAVEASMTIPNMHKGGEYVLCTVKGDNGGASEWAYTRVYTLPVLPDPPQVDNGEYPSFRVVKWRKFQEGDIGDGPVTHYYVYLRKENEDWGIYGKSEIPGHIACDDTLCQKRIGPLKLNTRYGVSVAGIRQGLGGVGKMSPVTIFKTPCENITDVTTPPLVYVDPTSPGHVVVAWDRRAEFCLDAGSEQHRVVGYRILLKSAATGWTLDTNVTAAGAKAVCKSTLTTVPTSSVTSNLTSQYDEAPDNCSSLQLFEMAQNSMYDVRMIRIAGPPSYHQVITPTIRFKTPCGKPFAKVINIRVIQWRQIPMTNLSTMVLGWQPIRPEDTGCDSVERYAVRIYDKHPGTRGAWPVRNVTVPGKRNNATISRILVNVPYYITINYRNNEFIKSSSSDLVPIRLEPEAIKAAKDGPLPGIDLTQLIILVVGAFILTVCLVGLVIFIIMRGRSSSYSSGTDTPPSQRKSSVSSATDLGPNGNGVYINMHGSNGTSNGLGIHTTGSHMYGDDIDAELVGKAKGKKRNSTSRMPMSTQNQHDNVMYSKAIRSNNGSTNGTLNHQHPDEEEAIYNTRLDAAIGHQKF